MDTSTTRVGIGTGSPHTLFHTHSDAGGDEVWVDQWKHSFDNNWNFRLSQRHDTGNTVEYGIKQRYNTVEYSPITFRGSTMELGGNVGIGTSSPLSTLQVGDDSSSLTGAAPGSISIAGTGATKSNGNKPGLYHRASIGLGLWSDAHMTFEVNGYNGGQLEAMRVNTSGYVGIGTTNPGIILDVGSSLTNPQIGRDYAVGSVHDSDKRDAIYFGRWDGTGRDFLGMKCRVDTHTNLGYGSYSNQSKIEFHTWGNNYASSREVMCIRGDGNVGIGTTTPGAQLHIGPKNYNHLYLASQNNNYGWKIDTVDNGNGDVPLHISQRYSSTDTAVMVMKQGGNVGIGTTGPGAPLEIVSTRNCESWSKGNSIFNILYDNGSGAYYGMSFGVSAPYGDGVIQTFNVSNNAAQHDLRLQPNGGWVAIGTTQPTELLHVAARSSSDSAFIRIQAGSGGSPATQSGIKLTESGHYGFQFVHEADTDLLKVKHQDSNGNVNQDNIMVWHPNGDVHLGKASKKNFHYNPNTWSYATQATTGNFWSVSYYFDHEGYVFVSSYGHWARKDSNNVNHVGGNEGVYVWVSVDNKTVADSGLYDSFSGSTANYNRFHEYWSPSSDGAGWWRDCSHSAFYKISAGWHTFSLRVEHGFGSSHYLNINGSGLNVFYIPKHYI